jgi:hypothetical protein
MINKEIRRREREKRYRHPPDNQMLIVSITNEYLVSEFM